METCSLINQWINLELLLVIYLIQLYNCNQCKKQNLIYTDTFKSKLPLSSLDNKGVSESYSVAVTHCVSSSSDIYSTNVGAAPKEAPAFVFFWGWH